MPGITFSSEDIASTNKLDAAFYLVEVKSIVEGPGKKDPSSTTWTCEFVVCEGPAKGTPIQFWFSDKMMKTIVVYASCFMKPEPGKPFVIEQTVGRKIKVFARWDMERKNNEILDFQKAA